MPRRRAPAGSPLARLAPLAALAAGASAALAAGATAGTGCAYDWTVGDGAASDASGDAIVLEGGVDGSPDAPPPVDGPTIDTASGGDTGPGLDANGADAPSCTSLEATVRADFSEVIKCAPSGTACSTETTDECGCPVVVGDGAAPATSAYVGAVSQFIKAGCRSTILCPDACMQPTKGLCVVTDAAAQYACSQL